MKEHPILFSTAMVKAILDRIKTKTRRVIKIQPPLDTESIIYKFSTNVTGSSCKDDRKHHWIGLNRKNPLEVLDSSQPYFKCPYGKVGDMLWVREKFREYAITDELGYTHYDKVTIEYAADNPPMILQHDADGFRMFNKDGSEKYISWKPSIFLKKEACRLWLKITDIQIQRLQDISQEDAQAEGVYPAPHRCDGWVNPLNQVRDCFKCAFKMLWNKINGASGNGWEANPWVWIISFKKIDKR